MTISIATEEQRGEIVRLLDIEQLPVEDLPTQLAHFFVATAEDKVVGVIGLEIHGEYGLLRSMVVDRPFRNHQVASKLVQTLEEYAKKKGLKEVYLLTLTAAGYFEKKGYSPVLRNEAPEVLQSTSEFTHSCPATAQMMKRKISI